MKTILIPTLGLALALASCSKKETDTSASAQSEATTNNTIANVLLKEAPKKASSIFDLRKTGKVGDKVTFTGAIIGGDQVFVDGRAIMIMGDPTKITSCDRHPGDNCPTPWDVCCDDPDVIKASILTVQVVDDSGKPLKSNLKGVGGLKELRHVSVTGVVAKGSSKSNMLINATGIYVHPKK